MTFLRGHFAMTLICAGSAGMTEVQQALAGLNDGSLAVDVREVPAEPAAPAVGSEHLITVHGADRLGIVARLTGVVAAAGGNITDLTTRLSGDLYVLLAEVELPPTLPADELTAQLSAGPANSAWTSPCGRSSATSCEPAAFGAGAAGPAGRPRRAGRCGPRPRSSASPPMRSTRPIAR